MINVMIQDTDKELNDYNKWFLPTKAVRMH